jgi:hypothetical protein
MNVTSDAPREQDELTELSELVHLVLQGAEVNQRPDLVRRLNRATDAIAAAPVTGTGPASVASTVVHALQSLEIDLRTRRTALRDPARTARLVAEMRHAEGRLRQFQERSREWPRTLGDAMAAAASDIEFDARARLRALLEEGTTVIASGARTREAFGSWIRERLTAEAEACCQELRTVADDVGRDLVASLELSAPLPPAELALAPSEELLAQLATRPQAEPGRAPLSGRLLGVVMPTYGGTMMALVLPRFFNILLPAWLIALSAAAGAFTMGGAAIAAERQRQTSRRNSEIVAAVRSVVDASQMALSKQIRAGVRALEQELYERLAAGVEHHVRLLSAEAAASRRAAEGLGNTDQAVVDIETDLASIHALRNRAVRIARLATSPADQAA